MSAPVPTAEIAQAQELCQRADNQKKQFAEFQLTLSELKVEMVAEDALIKVCIDNREFGSAGDKLMKTQPDRQKTVQKLDSELKGLLATQAQISDTAVSLAMALTGELDTLKNHTKTVKSALIAEKLKRGVESEKHTAKMEAQGKKHTNAQAAAKALHEESHKAKDEAHKDTTKKMETKHKAAVKTVTAALYEAEDQHVQKISKMVTVNQAFLTEVRLFVAAVRDVVMKRKDYEGVFVQMEASIKEIDAELLKFSNSATGPKDSVLDPVPKKHTKTTSVLV